MEEVQKKAFWKQAWFLVLSSMALLIVLLGLLALRDVDAVEPPAKLQYNYPTVADEDNIYVDLMAAQNDLEMLRDEWNSKDLDSDTAGEEELRSFLQEKEKTLPVAILDLRKAILSKKYYLSAEIDSIDFALPELSLIRFFYKYECALMEVYAQNGEWDRFDKKLYQLSEFYNKTICMNSLIEGLVFRSLRGIYLNSVQEVLAHKDIPSDTLKRVIDSIQNGNSWSELVKQSYVGELIFMKMVAKELSQGRGLGYGTSDPWMKIMRPNVFYESCFPYFEYVVDHRSSPRNKLPKPSPLDTLEDKRKDWWYLIQNREIIVLLMILPALDTAGDKIAQFSWRESFVSTRAACLLYYSEKGKLPDSLQDLVPAFLNAVPKDIYTGGEVQYNPKEGFFYVLGPDFKDDFGKCDFEKMRQLSSYYGDITQYIFPPAKEVKERPVKKALSKFAAKKQQERDGQLLR